MNTRELVHIWAEVLIMTRVSYVRMHVRTHTLTHEGHSWALGTQHCSGCWIDPPQDIQISISLFLFTHIYCI